MLMNKMPRNPATWRVEVDMDGNDAERKKWMKFWLSCHAGEMRETDGYWHLVLAQLPESGAWYGSQYQKTQTGLPTTVSNNADVKPCPAPTAARHKWVRHFTS